MNFKKLNLLVRVIQVLVVVCVFSSCTPEQSAEVRRREDQDRAMDRLNKAVGFYKGYLEVEKGKLTPLTIQVQATKNPTGNGQKPLLIVSLNIGLFGGVSMASTSTSFDWGSGEIVATFSRGPQKDSGSPSGTLPGSGTGNGPPAGPNFGNTNGAGTNMNGFELRAFVDKDGMREASLKGSHSGQRMLILDNSQGVPPSLEHIFELKWQSTNSPLTILKIRDRALPESAPETSDLPYFPGLDASLEFDGFAAVSQVAKQALYDPILGTLDIKFAETSWLHITGVALDNNDLNLVEMKGRLSFEGKTLQRIVIEPKNKISKLHRFPPSTFLGTYQGNSDALAYKVFVRLNPQLSKGANDTNLPFAAFPKMQLEVNICNKDEVMDQHTLELHSVDFLEQKALFKRLGTDQNGLDITFTSNWAKVKGQYQQNDIHAGGSNATLVLEPNSDVARLGCAIEVKSM